MDEPKSLPYSPEAGSRKTTLEIGPDGTIRMVYSDDLWEFAEKIGGDMKATCRASNIEWEEVSLNRTYFHRPTKISGWVIRAAHDKDLAIRMTDPEGQEEGLECSRDLSKEVAVYEERKTAIEVEIQFFHELLPPPEPQRCCSSSHVPIDTACRNLEIGLNGRCVFCDHEVKCHPGPGATCEIGSGEGPPPEAT